MDNDGNETQNQPPIDPNLHPEEISSDVTNPTDSITAGDMPDENIPYVYQENKTKYMFIIGGVVFFILILIGILSLIFRGGSSKPVTLRYWGLWEDKEVFAPLIAAYQKDNPHVTIQYEEQDIQNYRDKLLARSTRGQGPDIYRFHNTWMPEIKDVMSALPESIMSNAEFEKTFYDIHQKDLKNGDYYYGLPLEVDGLVLMYNEKLLKNVGVTSAPSNWEEVVNAATAVTTKQDGKIVTGGIALGNSTNVEHFSDIFGLMLIQNGLSDLSEIDQSAATGILDSYVEFAEPPKNVWDADMPNSINAFATEKVAMIFAPSWQALTINKMNPELKFKVAPIPSVPGAEPISIANYWVEGVSKYSQNQIEAWKFLKYLTEAENMTKLYENQAKVRLFGEPYSRVDLGPKLAQNNYLSAVIKQAGKKSYISLPVVSRTNDGQGGLNDDIVKYLENAITMRSQGSSSGEALSIAKQGIDQVLQRFKSE